MCCDDWEGELREMEEIKDLLDHSGQIQKSLPTRRWWWCSKQGDVVVVDRDCLCEVEKRMKKCSGRMKKKKKKKKDKQFFYVVLIM